MPAKAVYATQGPPLRQQIQRMLDAAPDHSDDGWVHAVIVPDSNRVKGGSVSAEVFKAIKGREYRHVIVVAPTHDGEFERINVCSLDTYRTPLGDVKVSGRLRDELCDEDDDIYVGDEGHFHTHGIDVQLPFLQTVLGEFDVVPIVMGAESPDLCRELGHAIGEIMYNQPTLIVACANITRAEDAELVRLRELIEERHISGLMQLMFSDRMEVEGAGAILVALLAAEHRRAQRIQITALSGPEGEAPGYIGALLSA
ncbi:MAG: AmmeMemoRadiSam system protein B [Rhodothermales bacterium]|nr:AmmeMemoRadiSam system protein B [Rhodothermales bacterium]